MQYLCPLYPEPCQDLIYQNGVLPLSISFQFNNSRLIHLHTWTIWYFVSTYMHQRSTTYHITWPHNCAKESFHQLVVKLQSVTRLGTLCIFLHSSGSVWLAGGILVLWWETCIFVQLSCGDKYAHPCVAVTNVHILVLWWQPYILRTAKPVPTQSTENSPK